MAHTLNQRVVHFAAGKVGQQVGAGECWDLADQALRAAGAKSSADLGPMGPDDDYVWGDAVDVKDVRAGDVLQFRDYTVTTTVVTEILFPDGSSRADTQFNSVVRRHHTAIVDSVVGAWEVRILEQNVKPLGKRVQKHRLPTADRSPAPTSTHKQVKDEQGKLRFATVTVTTTVEVTGTLAAYRPVAK